MNKKQNKSLLALVLVALLLTVAVSGTLAYLATSTPTLTNTFSPTKVDISVTSDYKVKSGSGDGVVDAYVRAVVLVNWRKTEDDGSYSYYGTVPAESEYTLTPNTTDWTLGSDGYYYYTNKLPKGQSTSALVNSFSSTATAPATGYSLTIEILAQAIQAEPASVVTDVWSSGVSRVGDDGSLTIKTASSGN